MQLRPWGLEHHPVLASLLAMGLLIYLYQERNPNISGEKLTLF